MKMRAFAAIMFVLLLSACGGGAADSESSADGRAGGSAAVPEAQGTEAAAAEEEVALSGGGGGSGAGGSVSDSAVRAADQDGVDDAAAPPAQPEQTLPDAPPARAGDRIIKEGTVSLEVGKDEFDRAFTAVIAAARRHGGDVVGSTTRTAENGDTFGSVTVRVPVDTFEDLVVGVGDIGQTRNRDIDSKDVSAEYTDLESRLRHLRAQEGFYLGLLDRAESVRDAIAVQQQLDSIQGQIEQIQGRLNVLEDRTSFSTLTVELFEPGAGGTLLAEEQPQDRPSLARYWDTARDAFVNMVGAILVTGVFLIPLLIVAAALFVGWRVLRRAPAPRPAARVEEREPVGSDV